MRIRTYLNVCTAALSITISQFCLANCGTKALRDNGNGSATDEATGLTWKRCIEGATYVDGRCQLQTNPHAAGLSWSLAVDLATKSRFAGKSDWRLPSQSELQTIIACSYIDSTKSDGYPGTRYSDGSPQAIWTLHACTNPNQTDQQKASFGQPGLAISPASRSDCQERNGMVVLLVRSEAPSEEFETAKRLAEPALERLRQAEQAALRRQANEARERERAQAEEAAYERRTAAFRKSVKEGDDTTIGIVVEVKGSLVKIQTNSDQCTQRDHRGTCLNYVNAPVERWVKRSEIYPPR